MRNRLIRCLLALYPRAWRRRYGREFGALLEDEPLGARALLDVLSHCLRQRFSPDVPMERTDKRFRFPRGLAFLMTVALNGVVIAIRIASRAAGDTSGEALITVGTALLMLLAIGAVGVVVQRALGRFKS